MAHFAKTRALIYILFAATLSLGFSPSFVAADTGIIQSIDLSNDSGTVLADLDGSVYGFCGIPSGASIGSAVSFDEPLVIDEREMTTGEGSCHLQNVALLAPDAPADLLPLVEALPVPAETTASVIEQLTAGIDQLSQAEQSTDSWDAFKLQRNAMSDFQKAVQDLESIADSGVDTTEISEALTNMALNIILDSLDEAIALDGRASQIEQAQTDIDLAIANIDAGAYSDALHQLQNAANHLKNAVK